jgi:hypothetical protein
LQAKEIGVVGVKRGIKVGVDSGEVDTVIFEARVVAHDSKAE